MIFNSELIPATLVKRYKRFLADVVLDDGRVVTAYCPNTGSMRSCADPGSRVYLSLANNPDRKYPLTLEMVRVEGSWVGVNTGLTNRLVAEALAKGEIEEIGDIDSLHREVKVGAGSRLDLLVKSGGRKIYIEVKNCSLAEDGVAMFPDAVTVRGARHLQELAALCRQGHQGVIFFLVQRMDAVMFRPAAHIDPHYAAVLREAGDAGVRILVYQAEVDPGGIRIVGPLPYALG